MSSLRYLTFLEKSANNELQLIMNKIINLNGNVVELDKIKGISHNGYHHVKPETHQVKIEFKTRKEYVFNPGSKEWEMEDFNDVLIIDYPNYDTAVENFYEIMQIWEDALQEESR